jgi:hypothetical protein
MASVSLPGLSQLMNWPTEHLIEAAERWTATAELWTEVFTQVWQDSFLVEWERDGAEALQNRTAMDKGTVDGLGDRLYEAARVTRSGASDLDAASARVRYAVEDARAAGFDVGEDLSVTDRRNSATAAERAARQAQAQAFAGDIRQRATQLVALDQQIAGRVSSALSGMGGIRFPEAPAGDGALPLDNQFRTGPEFGKGEDINEVDRQNRAVLDGLEEEYRKLPDGQIKTDRLADIAGIRQALKVPDSHLLFIEKPSDPSQMIAAATVVGDPFKADRVSVTVPGVGSPTRSAIANMTREAAGLRQEAVNVAQEWNKTLPPGGKPLSTDIATIAWCGYQPPPNLGSLSAAEPNLAVAGAPKLEEFLKNLDASSTNPNHTISVFGHSYGSLLTGIALKDGASQYVDEVVLYGSPGFEATSPAQLGMNDHNFFVMSAPDDPIRPIGALAPLHGWGADPNQIIWGDTDRYRFPHLETQAGATPLDGYKSAAHGHSDYGRDALQRMTGYNLATVLLGRPDLAVPETLPQH